MENYSKWFYFERRDEQRKMRTEKKKITAKRIAMAKISDSQLL